MSTLPNAIGAETRRPDGFQTTLGGYHAHAVALAREFALNFVPKKEATDKVFEAINPHPEDRVHLDRETVEGLVDRAYDIQRQANKQAAEATAYAGALVEESLGRRTEPPVTSPTKDLLHLADALAYEGVPFAEALVECLDRNDRFPEPLPFREARAVVKRAYGARGAHGGDGAATDAAPALTEADRRLTNALMCLAEDLQQARSLLVDAASSAALIAVELDDAGMDAAASLVRVFQESLTAACGYLPHAEIGAASAQKAVRPDGA